MVLFHEYYTDIVLFYLHKAKFDFSFFFDGFVHSFPEDFTNWEKCFAFIIHISSRKFSACTSRKFLP